MSRIVIALGIVCLITLSFVTPGNSEECRADIDGDGAVDGTDLAEMASDYGSSDCPVKTIKYIICEGTLSAGGRWCDNGDGTVTEMTTGLVWLQDAGCMGLMNWYDAIRTPIENLKDGICGLADGSVWGDWRLPTMDDLSTLANGNEAIRYDNDRAFEGVLIYYWSSSTSASSTWDALHVGLIYGDMHREPKGDGYNVWPVRGGN
jgi:hypothetical protein